MSKSSDALTAFLATWRGLKKAKPTEADLEQFGYPFATFDSLDEMFDRWGKALQALDTKGAWVSSPELAVADPVIAAAIGEANSFISGGSANGMNWLLAHGFMQRIHDIQRHIASVSARRIAVTREIAKRLAETGQVTADRVLMAEKAAEQVIQAEESVVASAQLAKVSVDQITESNKAVENLLSLVQKAADDTTTRAQTVRDQSALIEAALKHFETLKQNASKREAELETRVSELDSRIKQAEAEASNAISQVQLALRAARNQGLSGSFQDRSDSLQSERTRWILTFVGASLVLALLAILLAVDLATFTYEQVTVHILRKIALAAPFVWIGWYAARQAGRVAKVQEDYEYKAASALAFQSYREETTLGADPELTKMLLAHAIETFGQNPVRLYDGEQEDHTTPLQEAISKLSPEKIANILVAVGDTKAKALQDLLRR